MVKPRRFLNIFACIFSYPFGFLFRYILIDVIDAITSSSSIKQAQEKFSPDTQSNFTMMMPVFQSSSLIIDTSMLETPKPASKDNQEDYEKFSCIFFGARFSQESVIDEALKELVHNLAMKEDKSILSIECRAYRSLAPFTTISTSEQLVSKHKGTILVVYMTPSPESDEQFNKWYDEEHIPMLSIVPGWLSAKRFVFSASNYLSTGTMAEARKAPKYLAVHELENTEIFEKLEYKAATSTPWRTKVMESLKEKQRSVMGYVGQLVDLANDNTQI